MVSQKSDNFVNPVFIHVFQDPCFPGSMFLKDQVFQGPGFSGSCSKVRIQVLEVTDIKDVYQSIKETFLQEAIQLLFAKKHVPIKRKDVEVIFHTQKSVLYNASV